MPIVNAVDDDPIGDALERTRLRRRLPAPTARRHLREEAGLSQRDVAAALGVSRTAVVHWENGSREPSACNLGRYLEILDRCAREAL